MKSFYNRRPRNKYYVVFNGHALGIYTFWEECARSVIGFKGCMYQSFNSMSESTSTLKKFSESNFVAATFPTEK